MEIDPLCIESSNSMAFIKNEPGPAFPFINIDIKKEEVDLGEDTLVVSDEDDDSFLCPECAFTTHSESLFLLHCKHHQDSDKKVLTCAKCEYATTNRGDLNVHIMTKHPTALKPIILKAPDPDIKIKTEPTAATEPKRQSNPKLHCGHCDFSTASKRELCCHILLNQTHQLDDEFRCGGRCPFKTARKDDLIRHIKRLHSTFYNQIVAKPKLENEPSLTKVQGAPPDPECPIYKCSMCSFQGGINVLAAHFAKQHPTLNMKVMQPIKWYKCGKCGVRMRYEERISEHLAKCKGPHCKHEVVC